MSATTLINQGNDYLNQAATYSEPSELKGNDIVNFLNKLKEWAAQWNLDGMAMDTLHALYHWVVDEFLPGIVNQLPTYAQLIVTTVVKPILDKIHDAWFPHPVV